MSDAPYNIEQLRKALNQNRELITRTIRVYKFYDKLRSHNVLSLEDYEEIDNSTRYATSAEKAGHMLDIIDTKGPNGLQIFVQCLDDNYPELYKKVTGLQPSMPPGPVRSPEPVGRIQPFIDLDGVQKLYAQLDELSRIHSQDQLAIAELREEHFKLRFINTTCRSKLSKYPKMLEKQKQMDTEIKELKDEQYNMLLKISLLEKDIGKLRFERKEHKQLIDQLKQKLEDAVNMHTSQKHNWERTNSKNEQLAHDKNNLEKKLEHMQREIETVKRQSSLWSNKSFQHSVEISDQQTIDILKTDKEALESENAELVERLYKEMDETEHTSIVFEKMRAEYDELKHLLRMMQKDLSTTDKNYKLTWQELQKVSAERNQAFEQRDRAQVESQQCCKERDRLQMQLHEQMMHFKEHLYSQSRSLETTNSDDDFSSAEFGGFPRHKQYRVSNPLSDTSGASSDQTLTNGSYNPHERKSVLSPSAAAHFLPALNGQLQSDISNQKFRDGEFRPRLSPLTRGSIPTASPSGSPSTNGQPKFPANEFQLSADMSANENEKEEEERPDVAACRAHGGCVTPEDVRKNFAKRLPNFSDSKDSTLALKGSNRDKDYHKRVDLWMMKQSFRVRPPLNTSFSIDYDDEHDDLKTIFSDEMRPTEDSVRNIKQLRRRSRSVDDLTFSSDDSDELERPNRPKTRPKYRNGGIFTEFKNTMTPAIYKILWGSHSSLM